MTMLDKFRTKFQKFQPRSESQAARTESVSARPGLDHLQIGLQALASVADGAASVPGLKSAANIALQIVTMLKQAQDNDENGRRLAQETRDFIEILCDATRGKTEAEVDDRLTADISRFAGSMLAIYSDKCYRKWWLNRRYKDTITAWERALAHARHCFELPALVYNRTALFNLQQQMPAYMFNEADIAKAGKCLQSSRDLSRTESEHQDAKEKLEKAYTQCTRSGNQHGAAQCLWTLGNILHAESKHQEAREKLEGAHSHFMKMGDEPGAAQCFWRLGNTLRTEGKYQGACKV